MRDTRDHYKEWREREDLAEMEHYQVRPYGSGAFLFTTPTANATGFIDRAKAEAACRAQREQDKAEAYSDMTGPIAAVLRHYFDSLTKIEAGAATPTSEQTAP